MVIRLLPGVCLLSKLSTLKQEAYQAGKKKNWSQAIMFYEQILEQDKNNPTVINELGDLCLKGDESPRAVRYFLSAASKYRTTGLLNNSVAIYKKILRHDSENLNAHWYLAETRANQGLLVEGENHAIHFLDHSENVSGDIKEIFLKRCQSLFELFPQSRVILSRLSQIFHMWAMTLEASRAECLLAGMDFAGGKEDEARLAIDELTAKTPELLNYPEFAKWNLLINPPASDGGAFSDFGAIALDANSPETTAPEATPEVSAEAPAEAPEVPATPVVNAVDTDMETISSSGEPATVEIPDSVPEVQDEVNPVVHEPAAVDSGPLVTDVGPAAQELDDDGCFSIDDDDGSSSFDDLIAQASSDLSKKSSEIEIPVAAQMPVTDDLTESEESDSDQVDLLAQMLAEEGPDLVAESSGEVATITSEIGAAIGGDDEGDAERLYEMGLVYLEMGMFDQACDSFETAAADDDFCVRAHEMWGITLQRADRLDEAIKILNDGLEFADPASRASHGLMYHLGLAKEANGQTDEAIECFRAINDMDPEFADVGRRIAKLTTV